MFWYIIQVKMQLKISLIQQTSEHASLKILCSYQYGFRIVQLTARKRRYFDWEENRFLFFQVAVNHNRFCFTELQMNTKICFHIHSDHCKCDTRVMEHHNKIL